MNANQHLMANMARTEKAIIELNRVGAVVTDLNLGGAHPTIRVDRPGPLVSRVKAWSKLTRSGIVRNIEQCVIIAECQIVWQERSL